MVKTRKPPTPDYDERAMRPSPGKDFYLHGFWHSPVDVPHLKPGDRVRVLSPEEYAVCRTSDYLEAQAFCCKIASAAFYDDIMYCELYSYPWHGRRPFGLPDFYDVSSPLSWTVFHMSPGLEFRLVENDPDSVQPPNGEVVYIWKGPARKEP